MSESNNVIGMYHEATDLLPYRCPSCGSSKRFRSLVALRMHMSVIHSVSSPNHINGCNGSSNADESRADQGKNKWEEMLTSSKSVDSMFDKYSAKMDTILTRYDRESKELENKVRIAKQLDEIRKQKKELKKMNMSWKAAHDMSQLVKDTDDLIQRRVGNGKPDQSGNRTPPEMVADKTSHVSDPELQKQVELSIELAAKYKSLAIEAENKLKEKEIEEKHMKQYIDHVAKKEKLARQQLAGFMEEILERAECAEEELETYKSQSSIGGMGSNRSSLVDRRRSFGSSPTYTPKSSIKHRHNRSMTLGDLSSTTKPRQQSAKRLESHQSRDPYVEEMLEAPSSQELPRRAEQRKKRSKQLPGVDTRNLFNGSKLKPFSNVSNKTSPYGAQHREVVLFFVFAHLSSSDLLRCSSVCREWRDLSHDPQLWSRISFENVFLHPKLLFSISRWATETCLIILRNIDVIHDKHVSIGSFEEGLESVLKSCGENLLVISIENCDPVITSRSMWLLTCYNKNVRRVTYRSSLDPLSYQVAWAMGTACRNIESLEVAPLHPCSSCDLFNNNVARLMSWCWPGLGALSIGGSAIDGSGLVAVALNCHHLKVLELDHAKGVTEDTAQSACKHGLKDLRMLLFTHTPILASTVAVFLHHSPLRLLQVTLSQQDFFPKKGKQTKIIPEYNKLQASFQKLQRRAEYREILQITC